MRDLKISQSLRSFEMGNRLRLALLEMTFFKGLFPTKKRGG